MRVQSLFSLLAASISVAPTTLAYTLAKEYSGSTFFDDWEFYGNWDNLTNGNAWFANQSVATNQNLAYVNEAGNAIMRVDNFSTVTVGDRNSVRITSNDWYSYGSLLVVDLLHLPYGCSVWPGFWTTGANWPINGEIDIIENVNLASAASYALHTTPGCTHVTPSTQLGKSGSSNCSLDDSSSGCTVIESKPNSFGAGFGNAGGGVFATQIDVTGVFIWFWSRKDIPQSILNANSTSGLNVSDFGNPSAAYPNSSSCELSNFLGAQQLVFDITLCGSWAAQGDFYNATCGSTGPSGVCYQNNVLGDGSDYDNAYFEVQYLRAYTLAGETPTSTSTAKPGSSTKGAGSDDPSSDSDSSTSSAGRAARRPGGTRGELAVLGLWSALWCVVLGSVGVGLSVL